MQIENFELNKPYMLPQSDNTDKNTAFYTDNGITYLTKFIDYTGKITVTRLDLQNQIISGTFEFKAVNNNGKVVVITDGRFDKKFDLRKTSANKVFIQAGLKFSSKILAIN